MRSAECGVRNGSQSLLTSAATQEQAALVVLMEKILEQARDQLPSITLASPHIRNRVELATQDGQRFGSGLRAPGFALQRFFCFPRPHRHGSDAAISQSGPSHDTGRVQFNCET